jgi:hypothetical protein
MRFLISMTNIEWYKNNAACTGRIRWETHPSDEDPAQNLGHTHTCIFLDRNAHIYYYGGRLHYPVSAKIDKKGSAQARLPGS